MKIFGLILGVLFSVVARSAYFPPVLTDVEQPGLNGNATGAQLGSPSFGQSFTAGSLSPVYGIALAAVNTSIVRDLNFSLWRVDGAGSIVGNPLTSGSINAAQISAFNPEGPIVTPIWFPTFFDQPYSQTPGERLAFTVTGGDDMRFYFANGTAYAGGSLLGDRSRDLAFVTIVPEPRAGSLISISLVVIGLGALRRRLICSRL